MASASIALLGYGFNSIAVAKGSPMIAWDKDSIARFLGVEWAADGGIDVIAFYLADVVAELRVDAAKEKVELMLRSEAGTKIASWLYHCIRVDVHDDFDDTPCVTFWPPGNPLGRVDWFGIYRAQNGFSILTGSAPSAFEAKSIPKSENVASG